MVEMVGKGEMFLTIFVKKDDALFMRNVEKNYIVKDMIGYGWKGGVMIQFSLYDTIFSFINTHLESGQKVTQSRMNMARDVLREIGLFSEQDMIEPDAVSDFSFFLGDLNFRLNSTYRQHAANLANSAQLISSLDQLSLLR